MFCILNVSAGTGAFSTDTLPLFLYVSCLADVGRTLLNKWIKYDKKINGLLSESSGHEH